MRHLVSQKVLTSLYYAFVYPFLIYGLIIWGNTYSTTLTPIINLQKKALRIMTFANFDSHSSPLFKKLNILKLTDLIFIKTASFMFDFKRNNLPYMFSNFFTSVSKIHSYNTRLASSLSYSLSKIRTNYGKFGLRYNGSKIWNSINESTKSVAKKKCFKQKIFIQIIKDY